MKQIFLIQPIDPGARRYMRLITFFLFSAFFINGNAQFKAYFTSDTLRFESASNKRIDSSLTIVVAKEQSLKKGKIILNLVKDKSNIESNKIVASLSNEIPFKLPSDTILKYDFSVQRDTKDDRQVVFDIDAFDSTGKRVALSEGDTTITIYIKPYQSDTLSREDDWEFWLFTGTNFDVFDGVKPQEFFFRANTVIRIDSKWYLQAAFYRNRYFIADSTENNVVLQRDLFRSNVDSTYGYHFGRYQNKVKQTFDPVGLSLDFMYKIRSNDTARKINYFLTGGLDISTVSVTFQNSFSNFDTISFRTKNADTIIRGTSPFPPSRFSYKNKIANFNVGYMFIIDTKKFNIKGNLTAGLSLFTRPLFIYTRSGSATYQNLTQPYFQTRLFATYKPVGISLGFESYSRKDDFSKFNVTLSKVFDLEGFFRILSPVSSLSDKK